MTVINDSDLDDKYWCTTEQVRDRMEIEVGNSEPDFETRIVEATDAIQADWEEATGKDDTEYPSTVPDLLQYATAYLAASEAHLNFAKNVSGDNNGDQRHVFLEKKSEQKFEKWRQQADLSAESSTDDTVSGVEGRRGSLTDDIFTD